MTLRLYSQFTIEWRFSPSYPRNYNGTAIICELEFVVVIALYKCERISNYISDNQQSTQS